MRILRTVKASELDAMSDLLVVHVGNDPALGSKSMTTALIRAVFNSGHGRTQVSADFRESGIESTRTLWFDEDDLVPVFRVVT